MSAMFKGRCLCAAIQFEMAGPPLLKRACWCRTCQHLSCGNASINLVFDSATLCIEGAEPASHVSSADSGQLIRRRFCAICGTQLFSEALSQPGYVVVRAGALDDRSQAGPDSVIWTASAPPWGVWDHSLPSTAFHMDAVPD